MIVTKGSWTRPIHPSFWRRPRRPTTAAAMGLNVSMFEELRDAAIESDVRMIARQMTMDIFEHSLDDIIESPERGGAATYMETAIKQRKDHR